MHFHVTETLIGEQSHALGGDHQLTYPTGRPAFATTDAAIDAVMASAFEHWGTAAEVHVEVSLAVEVSYAKQDQTGGAVTGWAESAAEGATWSVASCTCTDGSLAQIFTGDH